MSRHRITRDGRGGAAIILTVNAAVFGGLGVLGMALTPLPTTLIRDLTSPPAASASVPTRPLSVLPGMGAGLELVRIPRGLDVHTVPWSAGAHRPVHLRIEGGYVSERHSKGGGYVGRHRSEGSVHQRRVADCRGNHGEGRRTGSGRVHRVHPDGHTSDHGRHHRSDQHVGGHHQGSHSQGGHHAEHGGEHGGGRADG